MLFRYRASFLLKLHKYLVQKRYLFWKAIFCTVFLSHLAILLIGFDNPIENHHSFRQSQTAITIYWMLNENLFSYIVPVTLPPWNMPRELPVYQFTVAILCKVFDFQIETCARGVSIFYFYLSAFLIYKNSLLLFNSRITARLTILLYLFSPVYLFWSRTCMIESCAVFFGFGFMYYALSFIKESKFNVAGLLVFGILAALIKITTFYPILIFLFFYGLFYNIRFIKNKATWYIFFIIFISVISWFIYCKKVNEFDFLYVESGVGGISWVSGIQNHFLEFKFWKIIFWEITKLVLPSSLLLINLFFLEKKDFPYCATIIGLFFAILTFANLYYVHDYYIFGSGFLLIMLISYSMFKVFLKYNLLSKFNYFYIFLFMYLLLNYTYFEKGYFRIQFNKHKDYDIFKTELDKLVKDTDVGLICGEFCNPTLPYHLKRKCVTIGDFRNHNQAFFDDLQRIKKYCEEFGEPIKFVLLPKEDGYEQLSSSIESVFRMKKVKYLEDYVLFKPV
jgi:hypothetical protein